MPPTREMPAVSLVVHSKTADTRPLDRGFGWTDMLEKSFKSEQSDFSPTILFPQLQWINKVGLVQRAYLSAKDTLKARFNLTPTTVWDEVTPGAGRYRVARLRQNSAANGILYSATSRYDMSADPEIAFTVIPEDMPPDWDANLYPPYQQIIMGGGNWGLHFDKHGMYLLRKILGVLRPVEELHAGRRDYPDLGEFIIFFRVIHDPNGRPMVCISTDWGERYKVYDPEMEVGATCVPDGPIIFRGQGGVTAFGVHQLELYDGIYRSSERDSTVNRIAAGIVTPLWYGRSGANIIGTDVSLTGGRTAVYQIQFVKGTQGGPWPVRKTACAGAVVFRYPFILQAGTEDDATPWDRYIMAASLNKTMSSDQTSSSISIHHDAFTDFDTAALENHLRWRKVTLKLGYHMSGDTIEWAVSWTGYIRSVRLNRQIGNRWGQVMVDLHVDNGAIRLKRNKWKPIDVVPLGMMGTLNNAARYILNSNGLDDSYAEFDAFGEIALIYLNSYKYPYELIKPNEDKWRTLVRIFRDWNMEPYPKDSGRIGSRTLDFVPPEVAYSLYPSHRDVEDIRRALTTVSQAADYSNNATSVYVYGQLENDNVLNTYVEDVGATDPGSEDFVLWEEPIIEEVSGHNVDVGAIVRRNQSLCFEHFPKTRSPWQPQFEVAVDPSMQTNTRVAVFGCQSVGIPDGQHHELVSLEHVYEHLKGIKTLRTRGGLRRIPNTDDIEVS